MHQSTLAVVILLVSFGQLRADTPANCTYEDAEGYWIFQESDRTGSRHENCDSVISTHQVFVKLEFPNVAVDKFGNIGQWTIIYNQGFEVIINYRRYFSFFSYSQKGSDVISYCNQTLPGWSHDLRGNNWACYKGRRVEGWETKDNDLQSSMVGKVHQQKELLFQNVNLKSFLEESYVSEINRNQKLWAARTYPELQSKSVDDLIRMTGGRASTVVSRPKTAPSTYSLAKEVSLLPKSFDWRNVNEVNYVSPVRNQGSCGSCYSFASMAMLEARVRILSNNTEKPVYSPQNIVDCSEYSQGCEGGFPYLIAGKYAQDFGVIPDRCYPYKGVDGKCASLNSSSNDECHQRTYAYSYSYIGGYYGACNEDLMMLDLVKNGPVAVGFEVYPDFMTYSSGVYSHEKSRDHLWQNRLGFNPFELTNHAVLIVGYGQEPTTGEKYWIVKNSWGTNWGMDGYFLIRRGNDECGIESLGVSAIPMP